MDIKAELFEGGFEVVDDLLSEDIGIGKVVGFFEAYLSESECVATGFVRGSLGSPKNQNVSLF